MHAKNQIFKYQQHINKFLTGVKGGSKSDYETDFFSYFRGTIGVHDITVGDKCHLYLGREGTTKRTGLTATAGKFDFEKITVAAGGEITSTHDLTGVNDEINIKVRTML